MTRWTTLLESPLPINAGLEVFSAGEVLLQTKPTALSLFESWERHQWNPQEISFEADHRDWQLVPPDVKKKLGRVIQSFVIGEYTGLDLLSPVMAGAPDENGLAFVATQAADEAKHSRFMFRAVNALWSTSDSERHMLDAAWAQLTPSYRALNEIERGLSRDTLAAPNSYRHWVRQVTMFHLVTEGMLAFYGQRTLVSALSRTSLFPGLKLGFTAMGRDEARHVSYGLGALRLAIQEGFLDEILDVLRVVLPYALTVDYPAALTSPGEKTVAEQTRRALFRSAKMRMSQLGIDPLIVQDLLNQVELDIPRVITSSDSLQEGSFRNRNGEVNE